MFPEFPQFALLSTLCIIAPGPDILSVIAYGISRGRRSGMLFGAGCATGCLLHTVWLCVGISALIAASPAAFVWLKIAGAGYLFYLAYRAFRGGILVGRSEANPLGNQSTAPAGAMYFRRGFLANALNPKVALLFLAVFPQFVQTGFSAPWIQFCVMGFTFAFLTVIIFGGIAYFSGTAGEFLKSHPRFVALADNLTGLVFLALGLSLLFAEVHHNS